MDRADKWTQDINSEVLDFEWYSILSDTYRCTRSVQIRSFIYQFAMRDLFPNDRLYKMKLVNSPVCPKCHVENETIMHMFWTCDTVHNLWEEVLTWLEALLEIEIIRNAKTVLLNYIDNDVIYYQVPS